MSGKYFEYKQCTNEFVNWIVKAAAVVQKHTKNLPNTVSNLIARVDVITTSVIGNTLLPQLSEDDYMPMLPSILNSAHRAINLRLQVHAIYSLQVQAPSSGPAVSLENIRESNEKHSYFVNILKMCHRKLLDWFRSVSEANILPKAPSNEDREKNIFNCLEIDDWDEESAAEEQLQAFSANSSCKSSPPSLMTVCQLLFSYHQIRIQR
jgi:hypothetical protein